MASSLAALRRRVTSWQARLGLAAWQIDVKILDEPSDCYAQTSPSRHYELATVSFEPGWASLSDSVLDQTIVHELLHCLTRDLDEVMADARSQLHPQASAQIEKRYEHELERFIDKLATNIYELSRA